MVVTMAPTRVGTTARAPITIIVKVHGGSPHSVGKGIEIREGVTATKRDLTGSLTLKNLCSIIY